jgi:phosphate:Na+ symporter
VEKLESTSSSISEIGSKSLKELAEKTLAAIDTCLDILRTEDLSKLAVLDAQEDEVDAFERQIIMEHANRLLDNQCAPMAGIVYTDLCTALERCADHAVNIAYGLVYKK